MSAQTTLERVAIISNFVPVECGNAGKVKDITSPTAGWRTDTGETFEAPKGRPMEMALDINCDARNGPIYLEVVVHSPYLTFSKTFIIGPMPGPVDPH